jgi:hypothetical protein
LQTYNFTSPKPTGKIKVKKGILEQKTSALLIGGGVKVLSFEIKYFRDTQ